MSPFVKLAMEQTDRHVGTLPSLGPIDGPQIIASSPWVMGWQTLASVYGASMGRKRMLADLKRHLRTLPSFGMEPQLLLVGGSFVEESTEPNDLDCLVLYTADPSSSAAPAVPSRRPDHLDVRHLPLDADPTALVKALLFFGELYGTARWEPSRRRPLLLVNQLPMEHEND